MPLPRCRIPILTVAGLIEIAALHQLPCRDAVQVAPPRARRERECHLYFARRVTFLSCADIFESGAFCTCRWRRSESSAGFIEKPPARTFLLPPRRSFAIRETR